MWYGIKTWSYLELLSSTERAKSVLNYVGLVSSWFLCHCATMPLWVQNFFWWAFRGSRIFSSGYFVGPYFFSWVFRWSETFSRGYFVGPTFFLVGISWVKIFSRGYFHGFKVFYTWIWHGSKIFSGGCFVGALWVYKWRIRINKCGTTFPINME